MKERAFKAIEALEFPILVFPILVICIVALGFVFKVPCSVWEWWVSIFATCGLVLWRNKNWKRSLVDIGLFGVVLFFVWILTCVVFPQVPADALACHGPAVRMLADGWNPVWQCSAKRIANDLCLSADPYAVLSILSKPKGIWYFCAVAYKFTNAHFNLFGFLNLYFGITIAISFLVLFKRMGFWVAVLAIFMAFYFIPDQIKTGFIIDKIAGLSGMGLLAAMMASLQDEQWNYTRLLTYTFWMNIAKPSAFAHCVIFWILFICLLVLTKRVRLLKVFVLCFISLVLFLIVHISPYMTSWATYGHPFYPACTTNSEKYPTYNLARDFLYRNEDAKAMGHVGAYANAYISHAATSSYYKWVLDQKKFNPVCDTWQQNKHTEGSPTQTIFRVLFCISLVLLPLLCGSAGGFLALCLLLGTFAMPTEMIGYIRYTPWALFGIVYSACVILSMLSQKALSIFAIAISTVLFSHTILKLSIEIDQTYAKKCAMRLNSPSEIYAPPIADCYDNETRSRFMKRYAANIRLLQKHVPSLAQARLVDEYDRNAPDDLNFVDGGNGSFRLPSDCDWARYSRLGSLRMLNSRKARIMRNSLFSVQKWIVTVTLSFWRSMHETNDECKAHD